MENKQMLSPSRQCSSTPVGFGHGFLSKEQCDNSWASSILSWPGSSLERTSLLWCYWLSKNATEELKRISQNGFQVCFQHLCDRW